MQIDTNDERGISRDQASYLAMRACENSVEKESVGLFSLGHIINQCIYDE